MSEELTVQVDYRLGIIPARTPHDVIVQATAIAKELAKIVKENRLSRPIQGREYVYVEGWSTMGAMMGVLPREIPEFTKRHDDGSYEATVELIRITDGAVIGRASAYVGMDEKDRNGKMTWGNRPEYARRSMAITRATGKAFRLGFSWIMGLAGYAPTPAEEMDGIVEGEFTENNGRGEPEPVKDAPPPKKPKTNGNRPYPPMTVKDKIWQKAESYKSFIPSDAQKNLLRYGLELAFAGDEAVEDKRHTVLNYLTGHKSTKDIPGNLFKAIIEDWLNMHKDSGDEYTIEPIAAAEAQMIYTAALKDEGQQELELES